MRARHIQQKPYRARTPETRGHERRARVKAPVLNLEVPRTTMAPRTLEKDNPERNFTKLGWQRQHADHANPSAATGAAMSNWLSAHSDGRPPATPDIAKHTHWAGGTSLSGGNSGFSSSYAAFQRVISGCVAIDSIRKI